MSERTRTRTREREATTGWEAMSIANTKERLARGINGKVVVKSDDREWETTRQGNLYWYLHPLAANEMALGEWSVFANDIRVHSGEHKHKGGVIIYVVEGKGYTLIDGVRENWEAGDLLLLPLTPGGVSHQHFNDNPGDPCKWVGFIYMPIRRALVSDNVQVKNSSEWQST